MTSTTSRFDALLGDPYGTCQTCDQSFETKQEADDHLTQTEDHSVTVSNPPRARRIANHISVLVDEAVQEACDRLASLVNAGDITENEADEALRLWSDFADGWANSKDELLERDGLR